MIQLTPKAIEQINKFKQDAGQPSFGLRIAVIGGGCQGLSYKLELEEKSKPMDKVLEVSGIKLFIDMKSALYVKGMTLDYSSGLNGAGFTYTNPNAAKMCGCGTSFGVHEK